MLGYEDLPYPPEMAESLAEPVLLARSLGVDVTRLRIKSLHPIPALLEAVAEQDPGIFVFGPDRRRIMRLRYWRAAPAIPSRGTPPDWLAVFTGGSTLFLSVKRPDGGSYDHLPPGGGGTHSGGHYTPPWVGGAARGPRG